MLTIKVNGREEKRNLGCRTFVTLDEMLKILESNVSQVTLNGKTVASHQYMETFVKSGDDLIFCR